MNKMGNDTGSFKMHFFITRIMKIQKFLNDYLLIRAHVPSAAHWLQGYIISFQSHKNAEYCVSCFLQYFGVSFQTADLSCQKILYKQPYSQIKMLSEAVASFILLKTCLQNLFFSKLNTVTNIEAPKAGYTYQPISTSYIFENEIEVIHLQEEIELLFTNNELLYSDKD